MASTPVDGDASAAQNVQVQDAEFKFKKTKLVNRIARNTAIRERRDEIKQHVSNLTGGQPVPEHRGLDGVERRTVRFSLASHGTVERLYGAIEDSLEGGVGARQRSKGLLDVSSLEAEYQTLKKSTSPVLAAVAKKRLAPIPAKTSPTSRKLKKANSLTVLPGTHADQRIVHVQKHGDGARRLASLNVATRDQLLEQKKFEARGALLRSYDQHTVTRKSDPGLSTKSHGPAWRKYSAESSALASPASTGSTPLSKRSNDEVLHFDSSPRARSAGALVLSEDELRLPRLLQPTHYQHFGNIVPIHEIPISSLSGSKEFHHNSATTPLRDAVAANTAFIDPDFKSLHPHQGYHRSDAKVTRSAKLQLLEEAHDDVRRRSRLVKKFDVTRDVWYWVEKDTGTVIEYDWDPVEAAAREAEKIRRGEERERNKSPVCGMTKERMIATWKESVGSNLFKALSPSQVATRVASKFVRGVDDPKWESNVAPNYTVVNVEHFRKPDTSQGDVTEYMQQLRQWGENEKLRQQLGRQKRVERESRARNAWLVREREDIDRQRQERRLAHEARDRAREANMQQLRNIHERKRAEYEAEMLERRSHEKQKSTETIDLERKQWLAYNEQDIRRRAEAKAQETAEAATAREEVAERQASELERRRRAEHDVAQRNEAEMKPIVEQQLFQAHDLRAAVVSYERSVKAANKEQARQRHLLLEAIQVARVTKQTSELQSAVEEARAWTLDVRPDPILPTNTGKFLPRHWSLDTKADAVVFEKARLLILRQTRASSNLVWTRRVAAQLRELVQRLQRRSPQAMVDAAAYLLLEQSIECAIGAGVSLYSQEVASATLLANKINAMIYKELSRRKQAATKLQNWYRVMGVNFETVRRRNFLTIVLEAYRQRKAKRVAAATMISRFRRAHNLKEFINSRIDRRLTRARVAAQREASRLRQRNEAATCIQRIMRGHLVHKYIEKHRVQLETERRARDAESFSRSVESAIAQHEETKRREDAAVYGQAVTYREKISREFPAWQRIVRRELTGDVPRLLQGVFMNSAKDVSSAVEGFGTSVDVFDFCGRSPVLIASALGHVDLLQELLLVHKARPHLISPVDGATAIMLAARGGHADALMILLDHCAELDLARENAKTAAQEARERELMHGEDVNRAESPGRKGKKKSKRRPVRKGGKRQSKGGKGEASTKRKNKGNKKGSKKQKGTAAKRKRNAKLKKTAKKRWTHEDAMAQRIQAIARARLASNLVEEQRLLKQMAIEEALRAKQERELLWRRKDIARLDAIVPSIDSGAVAQHCPSRHFHSGEDIRCSEKVNDKEAAAADGNIGSMSVVLNADSAVAHCPPKSLHRSSGGGQQSNSTSSTTPSSETRVVVVQAATKQRMPLAFPLPDGVGILEGTTEVRLQAGSWWESIPSVPQGFTAFHLAAIYGHEFAMTLLLEGPGGQRISALNRKTPVYDVFEDASSVPPGRPGHILHALSSTASSTRTEAMRQLEHSGGKEGGDTALHFAVAHGHVAVIDAMLACESIVDVLDLDARNGEGFTPLHLAARYGHADAMALLLEGGASLNTMALDGTTPLVAAVRSGSTRCVQQLLQAGAAQGCVTGPGLLTEAMLAAVAGDFLILKLLVDAQDAAFEAAQAHANANSSTNSTRSPRRKAAKNSKANDARLDCQPPPVLHYQAARSRHGDSLEDILQACHGCHLAAARSKIAYHQSLVEYDPEYDPELDNDAWEARKVDAHAQLFATEDAAQADLEVHAEIERFARAGREASIAFKRSVQQERTKIVKSPADDVDRLLRRSVMNKVFASYNRHSLAATLERYIGACTSNSSAAASPRSNLAAAGATFGVRSRNSAHEVPSSSTHGDIDGSCGWVRRRLGVYAGDMVSLQWYRFRSCSTRAWGPTWSVLSRGGADPDFYSKARVLKCVPSVPGTTSAATAPMPSTRLLFRLWYTRWRRRAHWLHHHLLHASEARFVFRAPHAVAAMRRRKLETQQLPISQHPQATVDLADGDNANLSGGMCYHPFPLRLIPDSDHGREIRDLLHEDCTERHASGCHDDTAATSDAVRDSNDAKRDEAANRPLPSKLLNDPDAQVYEAVAAQMAASGPIGARFNAAALWNAVETNDFAEILQQGIRCDLGVFDATCLGGDGRGDVSLLMRACELGHTECVRALAQCGADLNLRRQRYYADDKNRRDQSGETALMMAARCGHGLAVQALLRHNPAVDLLVDVFELGGSKSSPSHLHAQQAVTLPSAVNTPSSRRRGSKQRVADRLQTLVVDPGMKTLAPLPPVAVQQPSSKSHKLKRRGSSAFGSLAPNVFQNAQDEFEWVEHGRTALFLAAESNHPNAVAAFLADDAGAEEFSALSAAADALRLRLDHQRNQCHERRLSLARKALSGGIIRRLDREKWKIFRARQWLEGRGCNADGRLPQVKAKMAAKIVADCVAHPRLQVGAPGHCHVHLLTADQCMDLHYRLEQGTSIGDNDDAYSAQKSSRNEASELLPLDAGPTTITPSGSEFDRTARGSSSTADHTEHVGLNTTADGTTLAPGWEAHLDEDGYEYYYHPESGESQWERPTFQSVAKRVVAAVALSRISVSQASPGVGNVNIGTSNDTLNGYTNDPQEENGQGNSNPHTSRMNKDSLNDSESQETKQEPMPSLGIRFLSHDDLGDGANLDDATRAVCEQLRRIRKLEDRLERMISALESARSRRASAEWATSRSLALRGAGMGGGAIFDPEVRSTLHLAYHNRCTGRSTLNTPTDWFVKLVSKRTAISSAVPASETVAGSATTNTDMDDGTTEDAATEAAPVLSKQQLKNMAPCHSTPLIRASWLGFADVVRHLLGCQDVPESDMYDSVNGIDACAVDSHGRTALFYATKANHVSCIRELLEHGACPVAAGDVFHACPLLHAVSHGNEHIVLELLERGASIDGPPLASETPATLAAFLGDFGLMKLLVARGASMERVNANGENVEEVLQEIHRLSLKDAEELNLDDVVKGSSSDILSMARLTFTSIVGAPARDKLKADLRALKDKDGIGDASPCSYDGFEDDDEIDEPEGAMTPAQLSDALSMLGLETKYVRLCAAWNKVMPVVSLFSNV
eukprot:INCI13496.3.p1 GENE.INCI13496.3~~INCI13496.3.p1  ORF type:complete len:3083 (-),score=522.97 INCI13496.3:3142-12390(-)